MSQTSGGSQRKLLVIGTPALFDRVAKAAEDCALQHARNAAAAQRMLAADPDLRLLLARSADVGGERLAALTARHPDLHVLMLTTDRALVEASDALDLGAVAAVLPANASRAAIASAVEQAFARRERAGSARAFPAAAAERPGAVHDVPGAWRTDRRSGPRTEQIALRDDWLKVLAHDLRTPLGINNSYLTLLLEDTEHPLPDAVRQLVERIHANSTWMLEFVDSILDLAVLEERRPTLHFEPSDPGAVLSNVAGRMRGLAEARGVRIECAQGRRRKRVAIDRTRVEQVLHNLVANAIRYSDAGGVVRLGVSAGADGLTFEVRDTGRGMTREEVERAFAKFSSRASGRGLGLAIAKAIVELHGGRIWVESRPGRGSTFRFIIVPADAKGNAPAPGGSSGRASRGKG